LLGTSKEVPFFIDILSDDLSLLGFELETNMCGGCEKRAFGEVSAKNVRFILGEKSSAVLLYEQKK